MFGAVRRTSLVLWRGYRRTNTDSRRYLQQWPSSKTKENNNIILMGSPGCGKTTVGRILSSKLNKPVVDIDDALLEPLWGMPVSEKLHQLGSEGFLQAEGEALFHLNTDNSIVSLTGSNPMHEKGMEHVSKSGVVVFLDVHPEDILDRLERMKVNRIVGQNEGTPLSDILGYRQQFYENSYDVRVICERNEDPHSVADKVISKLNYTQSNTGYVSTRDEECACQSFSDVMINSLCKDGGLYVPKAFPDKLSHGELSRMVDLKYRHRARRVIEHIIPWKDIHPTTIGEFVNRAYSSHVFGSDIVFPLYPLSAKGNNGQQYLLELFHGPTASFKDAALQLLPQLFKHAVAANQSVDKRYLILVATSGDTGGAVLDGFGRHANDVGVLVLYPQDGISSIQRQQMIALSTDNAKAIGIQGWDFDDCQNAVKTLLNDPGFKDKMLLESGTVLSAANSISWGRLLPQLVYHVGSYLELVRTKEIQLGDAVDLCIPTGNFGNILAAFYAKKLGIPYNRLICASNSNNVLTDFMNTGKYDLTQRTLKTTSSPAIDILVSSNLERLLYHTSGGDASFIKRLYGDLRTKKHFEVSNDMLTNLKQQFVADWCNDDESGAKIRETLQNHDYLMDTHTAVAKAVADRYTEDRPMIIASTAHPGKFADDILRYVNIPTPGLDTVGILNEADGLSNFPVKHKRLTDCVKGTRPGEIITDPSIERIKKEIENVSKC